MTINGDPERQTLNSGGSDAQTRITAPTTSQLAGASEITAITLKQANEFVKQLHRHHKPVTGHKYSLGLLINGQLCGVAICGRPVARLAPQNRIEITRLCTNGTQNACSMLYGAAARAAKALGYKGIQTYILDTEPGTSLKASGWTFSHITKGRQWKHSNGQQQRTDQPTCDKQCWIKTW